jgi:hypothetical protein
MSEENSTEEYDSKIIYNLELLKHITENDSKLIIQDVREQKEEFNKSYYSYSESKLSKFIINKEKITKVHFFNYVNSASSYWSKIFCYKSK